MIKYLSLILFTCSLLAAVLFFIQPKLYLKNAVWQPAPAITEKLEELGDTALQSADVPVAAILLYDSTIIGTGYNTVRKSAAAAGHAEINAISGAMNKTGIDSFMKLDRERLTLVSTWEPCAMCRGAIIEYGIKHVCIMKCKPVTEWWRQLRKEWQYEYYKQAARNDTLQESLFKKHPLYGRQDRSL